MRVTIDDVQELAKGVWSAPLEPDDVIALGRTSSQRGLVSVLLVDQPDHSERTLTFDRRDAYVANVGSSAMAILLGVPREAPSNHETVEGHEGLSHGDDAFLTELTTDLKDLGQRLLSGVRQFSSGRLVRQRKGFVERPDNFWAVRIQPRDGSLRISVRGAPSHFTQPEDIELKPGRGNSYSEFKISKVSQIDSALRIIRRAIRR